MSFEANEQILNDLGRRMIDAAGSRHWNAVAELHGELHQRLVELFKSDSLPDDGRPVRLLEQLQAVGDSVASLAAAESRHCGERIKETRQRQRAHRSYSQCFLA